MKCLVTGGAGYIGSIAVKELITKKHEVIVVDNLSKGIKKLVNKKAKFYKLDLTNYKSLSKVFQKHKPEIVMHFAGYKAVEESMQNPEKYSDNVIGTANLLKCMNENKTKKIIYSSTAAVYKPHNKTVTETDELEPNNYYGETKRICEQMILWFSKIYGIKYTIFRYFNVIGDGGLNYIDPEATNVLPIIMEVVMNKRPELQIFGTNYPTRDGTCIRDYIDVIDLVDAHIKSLNKANNEIINLATNSGTSVKELVSEVEKALNITVPKKNKGRRAGDPPTLVASNKKAQKLLKWTPKISLKKSILATYKAYN